MSAIGIIGILIGIVLLIWLTVKGIHVVILAPACALLVIVMNQMAPLTSLTEVFMGGAMGFFKNMFFVLLLGALFAQIFEKSGAALSITNGILGVFVKGDMRSSRGILTCVISQIVIAAIFMFGGIDGMTELITVFPICLAMCKKMNITRNLVPALAFTTGVWAMCSPGAPQAVNEIAAKLCGTTASAGLVPGIIAAACMAVFTIWYLYFEMKRAMKLGLTFESLPDDPDMSDERRLPNFWVSIIPMAVIFVTYNFLHLQLVTALAIGVILSFVLLMPTLLEGEKGRFGEFTTVLSKGADVGVRITIIAAVLAGFGNVVSNTPTFTPLIEKLSSTPIPILFICLVLVAVICAITSNSNGGIQVALNITIPMAQQAGVSMAALHRVAIFAASSLNTLPTNPGVMITCQLAKVPMKAAYRPIFVLTVVAPFVGAVIVAVLYMLFPGMA